MWGSLVFNKKAEWKISQNLKNFQKISQVYACTEVSLFIKIKAEEQHANQIVDSIAFFNYVVYNKIQVFCTVYAACSYALLESLNSANIISNVASCEMVCKKYLKIKPDKNLDEFSSFF